MRSSIHAGLRLFPSYIFYWMPSASLRRCEQPINTSPPEGGEQAPNFGPSSGGPARPPALRIPTPTSGAGPPRRCLRHRGRAYGARCVLAAAKYRLIRARRWPPCGWVRRAPRRGLVGVRRLRDALRRITGHGVRMPAPGPPTAARLIVLPPIASNGCAPFSLVGSRGGVPLLAVQAVAGRAKPFRGSGGATPCRGAALGGGRDAGLRVKGAAPCQSRGTLAAFHATPPLWGGGVKYSRS